MKKLSFFLVIAGSFLFNSCSKDLDANILIRVNNQSGKPLSDIVVFSELSDRTSEVAINYGSLPGGQTTTYKRHQRAYFFPLLEFTMQGYPTHQKSDPRCPVPEMTAGKYSILIWDDNGPQIRIVKDE